MNSLISWIVPWIDSIRMIDPVGHLVWLGKHHLFGVLERQADRVERLDRAVMKVLCDALAFLENRKLSKLLVHARVVDGQASVASE